MDMTTFLDGHSPLMYDSSSIVDDIDRFMQELTELP